MHASFMVIVPKIAYSIDLGIEHQLRVQLFAYCIVTGVNGDTSER